MSNPSIYPSNFSLQTQTKEIHNLISYIAKNPNPTSQLDEYIADALNDVKAKIQSLETHIDSRSQQIDNSMLHLRKQSQQWQRARENAAHLRHEADFYAVRKPRSDHVNTTWTQSRVAQHKHIVDMRDSSENRLQLERELLSDMEGKERWDFASLVEIGTRRMDVISEPMEARGHQGRNIMASPHPQLIVDEDITELSSLSGEEEDEG